jgi:demethoxyubiquinone hydroxylase (CLK1/Coq7/Cat5 family)
MEISEVELRILNFYRISELHGGLILGRMVPRARDPRLVVELTRHSAEEVLHSQLWAETIVSLGGRILPARASYQRRLAERLGHPGTMLHVLAVTQIFERRVYRHFLEHLRRPDTHRRVQATLHRMIEEERHHLSWVKEWLDQQAQSRPGEVDRALRQAADADALVYPAVLAEYGWTEARRPEPAAPILEAFAAAVGV